jgi:hypothetical protein
MTRLSGSSDERCLRRREREGGSIAPGGDCYRDSGVA